MRTDNAILAGLACLKVAIHLAANAFGAYGYVRDELYYLACSDRMAWGYVDHPPFSVAALWLSRLVAGDSLVAIRVLPALSGAVVVVLAGLITRELGGRRFAQVFAACCTLAAPLTLGIDSVFSMNSFEVCLWTLACYQIVLLTKQDTGWQWLLLGCTLGVGLLNKVSTLWFGAGLAVGLLAAPNRRVLLTWKPWAAAGLAGLMFLPHVFWQVSNGYPTVEFMRNVAAGKYAAVSPGELLAQQALFMNPLTFPFWFGGLWYALVGQAMPAVPRIACHLPGGVRHPRDQQERQGRLPDAPDADAVCPWRGRDGTAGWPSRLGMDADGGAGRRDGGRRCPGADGLAGAACRHLHGVRGRNRRGASAVGVEPARAAASTLRRHVRMGRHGGRRGGGAPKPEPVRTGAERRVLQQLRRGRRHRFLRTASRASTGGQRPQQLLALGAR